LPYLFSKIEKSSFKIVPKQQQMKYKPIYENIFVTDFSLKTYFFASFISKSKMFCTNIIKNSINNPNT
jgi:hypothetical protein